jgi:hypothetical protein
MDLDSEYYLSRCKDILVGALASLGVRGNVQLLAVTTEFYYAQLLRTFYILTMFLC